MTVTKMIAVIKPTTIPKRGLNSKKYCNVSSCSVGFEGKKFL